MPPEKAVSFVVHNSADATAAPMRPSSPIHPSPSRSGPSTNRSAIRTTNEVPVTMSTGNNGSQAMSVMTRGRESSPAQQPQLVGVDRLPVAEDGDDDRQADRSFRGGDGHDEEHDHLSVDRAELAREGDEGEIGSVQHQLDREEDHDGV